MSSKEDALFRILKSAKKLARRYHALTDKPLGITGEVAEHEAKKILKVELSVARNEGFDATERKNGKLRKLQIKGRCLRKKHNPGAQVGLINVKKSWDAVLLVLLDENYDATKIYDAPRRKVVAALKVPGSRNRRRGALSVRKLQSISTVRWHRKPE